MKKKVITRQKYLLIDPKLKLKTIFFACRLSTLTKSHETNWLPVVKQRHTAPTRYSHV